jgi:ABC-type phosphate transport system auxiliary subunit
VVKVRAEKDYEQAMKLVESLRTQLEVEMRTREIAGLQDQLGQLRIALAREQKQVAQLKAENELLKCKYIRRAEKETAKNR